MQQITRVCFFLHTVPKSAQGPAAWSSFIGFYFCRHWISCIPRWFEPKTSIYESIPHLSPGTCVRHKHTYTQHPPTPPQKKNKKSSVSSVSIYVYTCIHGLFLKKNEKCKPFLKRWNLENEVLIKTAGTYCVLTLSMLF